MISKTLFELYKGRKPNISHPRSFGCKYFVLNIGKHTLEKFDARSDEVVLDDDDDADDIEKKMEKMSLDNKENDGESSKEKDDNEPLLEDLPTNHPIVGTKWVFKNKMDELGNVSIGTPMSPSTKLDKDDKGKDMDQKLYRGMIGSLLYLTANRPDILFSVCLCARFQSCPKESHLIAVKRIFRYLLDTQSLGLWYPKGSSFNLVGYSDADFAGTKTNQKSTSGTCQFLGNMLVSWSCKKQNSVALSTVEAKYISLGSCCAQILWIRQQLNDFGMAIHKVPIYCDNMSAINISKNPIQHSKTKHIKIKHHFIRDHVLRGDIEIDFVYTLCQLDDIFTKPLNEE
ncbi:Cysteine-rich RLK (RECEPTOR-like protein kinase) 8 [Theobroma cacao]|uniref:Cysteine-rich RLK (RECEPTOR-like protein kinase) 8 n=1 Tax=Theobroma cacao TaxID=3641 RepID=A0A061GRZ7_THECC|nr:Cysteine-rich RLK (RECEPTOR-like protein kinase) 8 [Theobroma cacao]